MRLDERGARLTFRLLGPLEVVRDGSALTLGGAKQRTLLALLAARLLGLSDRLFGELGAHVEAIDRETHLRAVAALKRRLGEVAFEAAYNEGRAAGLESLDSAVNRA